MMMLEDSPFLESTPAAEKTWIVVCSGCFRTQHDGQWTDVQVTAVDGRASAWCDDCARSKGATGDQPS
jgi:hypothetical protein